MGQLMFPLTEEAVTDRVQVLTQRLFFSQDQQGVIKYLP